MSTNEPESLAQVIPATLAGDLPQVDTQTAPAQTDEEFQAYLEERSRALVKASRLSDFKASCPMQFKKKIDRALIRNLAAWDQADQWQMKFPGVWLWSSSTGEGKSRMAWRLLGRAFCEYQKTYVAITGQKLAEIYFGYHMEGNPADFYRWFRRHDIVLIDDIDKCDLTVPRNGPMLREVFDVIYQYEIPVIVTSNEPISYFQKRLGESTNRRMHVCGEIKF